MSEDTDDHPIEIEEGMVFALETYWPATDGWSAARIEEEIVVTETGIENFTAFMPGKPEEIEKLMSEPGLLQLRAPTKP